MRTLLLEVEQFLEFIIQGLVNHPDQVVLIKLETESKIIFSLQVAPEDVGQVIGKHGQTIAAIRAMLSAGAARVGRKAILEIEE